MCRQAAAMLVAPAWQWPLRAKLCRVAITAGPLPAQIWQWVFGEGHIADPVQFVLDRPTIADDLGELVGADVTEAEVGDGLEGRR